jgi:hypothetical protein
MLCESQHRSLDSCYRLRSIVQIVEYLAFACLTVDKSKPNPLNKQYINQVLQISADTDINFFFTIL